MAPYSILLALAKWLLRESNPCYRRERAMSWPLDQGALYVNTFSGVLTPPVGLEPTTTRLTAECSTDWAKEEYKGMFLQNYTQSFMISSFHLFLFLSPIGYALDLLVTVSYVHYCTSTSVLSTSSSSRGLTTCVGISHLEGGFTLRCLQRLSRPGLATLPCSW